MCLLWTKSLIHRLHAASGGECTQKGFKPTSGRLDGSVDIAWSAAFISYCMQIAGVGTEFPYSSGHTTWIVKSIRNGNANKMSAAIFGYRPVEMMLALGDLVGRGRGDDANVGYHQAVAKAWFTSHTDIVVARKKFFTIGGNVGQSLGKKEFTLDADGMIAKSNGLVFHIVNNITGRIASPASNALALNVG